MYITMLEIKRREAGLTKAALGKKAGIAPTTVGLIEHGRFNPYPVQLERLASVLGVVEPEALLEKVEV